jgi:3-isopropylmalate/(R)-2-methylmalate dehydratase small subunit
MAEIFSARVWVMGNDIDTDIVIPTEYLALKTVQDMTPYAFSPLRPELAGQIQPGDVIVAGSNFGCGSSREQAPEVIKALGVRAVIAGSFARIFYRNAINNGLLLIECPALCADVEDGDEITVEVGKSISCKGRRYPIGALPDNLLEIINAGGLVKAMRRRNGLEA